VTIVAPGRAPKPDLPALTSPSPAPRAANATLVGREDFTPVLARFHVSPDDGPVAFVAGQYAALSLASPSPSPRPYSIASRPGARDLAFLISLVRDGTLTPRLFELGVGARVHVGPARGLFRLDADDRRDHVLIGTGSGIAPLLAMLAELRSRRDPPRTTLLHGARVRAELAGAAEIEEQDPGWLSYRPTLSRPHAADAWDGLTGHVGVHLATLLRAREVSPARTVAYLCGSAGMAAECSSLLSVAGVPPSAIRIERFTSS
jgi:ferredoxin-NADP reductase